MRQFLLIVCATLSALTYVQHASAAPETAAEARCQRCAFLDALILMNAVVRASLNTPQQAAIAQAELDAILRIAIRQAATAYPCARGTLLLGFDKNYADTVRTARTHAASRKLPPDVLYMADQLMGEILTTGAPPDNVPTGASKNTAVVPRIPGPFMEPRAPEKP
jgi:hypothetical protein